MRETANCQKKRREEMNPRKTTIVEPEVDDIMDPFREPRTIPVDGTCLPFMLLNVRTCPITSWNTMHPNLRTV
jgi:hypothetical protein